MVMEPRHNGSPNHINGFSLYDDDILPILDHSSGLTNGYSFLELPYTPPYPNNGSSTVIPDIPSQEESPDEFSECVFNFIEQILVEEDEDGIQSLFFDPLDLQATERSLYEALGEEYPSPHPHTLGPNEENTNSSTGYSNSAQLDWPGFDSLLSPDSLTRNLGYQPLLPYNYVNGTMNEMLDTHISQNRFTESESIKQFNRGVEEANKFLPSTTPLVLEFNLPEDSIQNSAQVVAKNKNVEKHKPTPSSSSSNGVIRGRKHHELDDNNVCEEERSSKHSAIYVEEDELSEMFDRVLLAADVDCDSMPCEEIKQNGQSIIPNNNIRSGRKKTSKTVDVSTLLINCAQAVAASDRRTAAEQLHHIKQHASTSGDASRRLAHVFAAGIEARLDGTGSQLYAAQTAVRISPTEKLQAYQVYLSACPFQKIAFTFANKTIYKAAASTASIIHVVDFGIAYGFQWPIFIKHLSERPDGPPKLRITGIEFPQPGFRPAERLDETGRMLANYCDRFKVAFEYNAITSRDWETIKIEDLRLRRHEFVAVNSLIRFHNLLDETVVVDSPRDKVLKLIRDMKPDVFVHSVINGVYNTPFFATRFKETLFHYSALFDMFDATIERVNHQRMNFEKEFYGREAMNVIACEGNERVERPESYKQWQVRTSRAGFKIKALNQELVANLRCKRAAYHKDFVFDEDGKWILQGWKGKILYASSCWVPA